MTEQRHGITGFIAAMNVLEGKVLGSCYPRHRHVEFLNFLRTIDREVPGNLDIHMIPDNYGTHSYPNVKPWLGKHPRFQLHITPASSSWLNFNRTMVRGNHAEEDSPVYVAAFRN